MSTASMIPVAVLGGLEQALNAVLALDPDTTRRLGRLEGRIIAIELKGTGLTLYAAPKRDGLRLMSRFEGLPDTTLHGTPLAMLRMGGGDTGGLFSGDVTIDGDVEVGQRFRQIIDGLEIDWEEHLSRLTGDIVAHQVGNVVRSLAGWRRSASDILARDVGEYVKEEMELLPDRDEVTHFMNQVDTLHADVDRLEARIQRLRER